MVESVIKTKSYSSVYDETLKMADDIKKKIDITIYITVGPYPVDYLQLKKRFGRNLAMDIMKKGIDKAAQLYQDNKIIAIGEIGRPHFTVDKEIIDESNEILIYGIKKAKEVGTAVVLHTETTTSNQCKMLAEIGEKIGLPAHKIVKHFSPPLIRIDENYGLMPSVLASKRNITNAIKKGTRFLMETDYIDDPKRPGAVLGPKTVPKRSAELLDMGLITEEDLFIIHKENPERTYDINLE
jgi:TatD-related deoxyribonuclease